MPKTRIHSTSDLQVIASRLEVKAAAKDIENAKAALLWCAKVIDAADRIVHEEAVILASARRRRHPP